MSEELGTSKRLSQFRKPRSLQPHAWFMTRTLRRLLRALARLEIFNVTVVGRENVPRRGRVIVAVNHRSMADPVFVWGALRRNAPALAMAELWKMPFINVLLWLLGMIPVKRGNSESGRLAVRMAIRVLEYGGLLLIFPEGRCNEELGDLYPGVAEIAIATDSPIVPGYIVGSELVKPLKGEGIHREHPVRLAFGPQIDPHQFTGDDQVHQILDALRSGMLELAPV